MGQQTVKVGLDLKQTVWFCRRVTRLNWVLLRGNLVSGFDDEIFFVTWTKQ